MHTDRPRMECFVCCDDDDRRPLYAACRCQGRHVHVHCLLRTIRECASHADLACPVCRALYSERVHVTTRRAWRWPPRLRRADCVVPMIFIGFLDLIGSIVVWYWRRAAWAGPSIMVVGFAMIAWAVAFPVDDVTSDSSCCAACRRDVLVLEPRVTVRV